MASPLSPLHPGLLTVVCSVWEGTRPEGAARADGLDRSGLATRQLRTTVVTISSDSRAAS